MTHIDNHTQDVPQSQESFEAMLKKTLQEAVRTALMNVLEEEVESFIGATRYQRNERRRDYRNGHYTRDLQTSMGSIDDLSVPRTRGGFHTQVFDRSHRRRPEVDQAIGDMFIDGVSMAKVGAVMETLTGSHPSPSTVSRVFHSLEEEYAAWKQRPLAERYACAFADGTYFSVIHNDEGCKMPILAVVGITEQGAREVVGFSVGDHENQLAWEALFDDLKHRGVNEIGL